MEQASLGKVKPSPAGWSVWEALPFSIYPQETGRYCRDPGAPGAWALGWQWEELRGKPRAEAGGRESSSACPLRAQPTSSSSSFPSRKVWGHGQWPMAFGVPP